MEKNICTNCIYNTNNYCDIFKQTSGTQVYCTAYKEGNNSNFTRKEIQLLIALVEAQKASISLLRGFKKPNREEQDENAYYNLIINKLKNKKTNTEDISDGYHAFKELYEFRKVYNAVLFNEWFKAGKYNVHKSKRHFDGDKCFGGGWFIVVAILPTGQISNHYEMKDWDLFNIPETEKAKYEFDGHTPQDVIERLANLKIVLIIWKKTFA